MPTGAAPFEDDGASPTSSGGTTTDITTTSGTVTTAPMSSSTEPKPDPTTSSATTEPPLTTGRTDPPETSDGSSGSDTGRDETGDVVDCTIPRTYVLGAADAQLSGPMQLGSIQGIDHVFSTQADAGQATFAFDVECPSVYRLFARVRDDVPGVNNCCDPDSFVVELGGGSGIWYYGCDTVTQGFSWQVVEDGEGAPNCGAPEVMTFDLSVGEQLAVFRNREAQFKGAVAGLAEVVLTNDPTYQP